MQDFSKRQQIVLCEPCYSSQVGRAASLQGIKQNKFVADSSGVESSLQENRETIQRIISFSFSKFDVFSHMRFFFFAIDFSLCVSKFN